MGSKAKIEVSRDKIAAFCKRLHIKDFEKAFLRRNGLK